MLISKWLRVFNDLASRPSVSCKRRRGARPCDARAVPVQRSSEIRQPEILEERCLLASVVFSDGFDTGSLNRTNWPAAFGALSPTLLPQVVSQNPSGGYAKLSSPPASGPFNGSVGMVSRTMNLADVDAAVLTYSVGTENTSPESGAGERLLVQYRRPGGTWGTIFALDASDAGPQPPAASFPLFYPFPTFPGDAFHSNFALAFSANGLDNYQSGFGQGDVDVWTLNNVELRVNRRPSISTSGAGNVADSSHHTLSWNAFDPDRSSLASVDVDLMRGSTVLRSSSSASGSLQVLKSDGPGSYRLRVRATERPDNTFPTVSREVYSGYLNVVDDDTANPSIVVGGSSGTEVAAGDQHFTWSISDASGSTSDVTVLKNGQPLFSRHYTTDVGSDSFDFNSYGVGSYTLSITATDNDTDRTGDQLTATEVVHVNVVNASPLAAMQVTTPEADRREGSVINFDAGGSSDPEGDALQYVWNFGDGNLGRGLTATHTYIDDGSYPVTLTVVDAFGGIATTSLTVEIANVAPVLTAVSSQSVPEAATFVLDLSVIEPGDDATEYLVEWGDGQSDTFTTGGQKEHVYAYGGIQHTLAVSLLDEDGSYPDLYVATITVEDAAPILQGFSPFVSAEANVPIDWNVSVIDGAGDTHTYAWDYGDQSTETGLGLASVQHSYTTDGTYTAVLTVTDSDGLSATQSATVVIGAPVSFVGSGVVVDEDTGTITISAALVNGIPQGHDVTVDLAVTGTVSAADYDFPLPQIVIPQGQLSGSTTIEIHDDSRNEDLEDLRIVMDSTSGASRGTVSEFLIEVQDNDGLPSVYFTTPSLSVTEDAGQVSLTATLSGISGRDVVVPFDLSGTGTSGVDFIVGATSLLIPAGATSGTLDITMLDDNAIEAAETIIVSLQPSASGALSAEVGQPTVASLIIAPSDAPDVALDSAYRVTTEDTSTLFITARLSRFSDVALSVPFVVSGTADNGADYDLVNAVLEFAPGSSEASVRINMINDSVSEGVETLVVELQPAANVNLGTTQLTVTDILDDDLVRVSFEPGVVSQFEGNAVFVKVLLSNPSATDVIVPVSVDTTAVNGSDFTVSPQTIVIPAFEQEATVRVDLLDDTVNELSENLYLSLGPNIAGGFPGEIVTKQIEIKDTDPFVSVVRPGSLAWAKDDGPVAFDVELTAPTDEAITIPIRFSGTAKRGSDFTAPTSVVIPAGQTTASFNLTIVDDIVIEDTERVTVALGTPSAGILQSPIHTTLSIEDNDAPVRVFWRSREYSAEESDGEKTLTIGLSRPAASDVTVTLNYDSQAQVIRAQSLASGRSPLLRDILGTVEQSVSQYFSETDFAVDLGETVTTVTIPQGETSATVAVPIIDDFLQENSEIVTITLDSADNAVLPADTGFRRATLTISDADVLTVADATGIAGKARQFSSQELIGVDDVGQELSDFATNETNQEDLLGVVLFVTERLASTLPPGPTGFIVAAGVHAVKWTQEEYPDGLQLDTVLLKSHMDSGVYYDNLGEEMKLWAATYIVGNLFSLLPGPPMLDQLQVEGLTAAAELASDYYRNNEEKVNRAYEQAGKNLRGFGDDPGGTATDEIGRIDDNIIGALAGYVEDARIVFDRDFNSVHNDAEPYGRTTSSGDAVFADLRSGDADGDGVLEPDEGQWVVFGGTDTSVNSSLSIVLTAPADYRFITPTSTLISAMINSGAFERSFDGVRAAEQRFFQASGVPSQDLARLNILQEAAVGNVHSAALFAKETQYYNTVVALAALFDGTDSGLQFQQLARLVFADLADKISSSGSSVNLTSPLVIKSLIQGVSVRTGIVVDTNVAQAVAETLGRSNAIIDTETPVGSTQFLDEVVEAHQFVQSELTDEIADLVRGNLSIEDFNSNNSDLESRIRAAETFDILPLYLFVEDASIAEGDAGDSSVLNITVTPVGSSVRPASVTFGSVDRNAIAGEDYESVSGTLTWGPGDNTSRTISVPIYADSEPEPNEAFAILFSNPQAATLLTTEVNGIIENDDAFTFDSAAGVTDNLVLSIEDALVSLENNGVELYTANAGQGTEIVLSGQDSDSLTLFNSPALDTVVDFDLLGQRTVRIGEHVIRLDADVAIVGDVLARVNGIPQPIFAETPLSLSAVVPSRFNADSLSVEWGVYGPGDESPVLAGTGSTFDFVPEEEFVLVQLTVSDGLSTSTVKHQIHVFPPNVAPVANDDAAVVTENTVSSTDVIANDTDLNPEDTLSLVAGSVSVRSATRDDDGTSVVLATAQLQASGNDVVFDPAADFDFLADGEQATILIDYTVTDDNVGQLTDDGVLTITVVGTNDAPVAVADHGAVTVFEAETAVNQGGFSDLDETDHVSISATVGTVVQEAGNSGSWTWTFDTTEGPGESQTVTITADDGRGGVAAVDFQLTVENVAPSVTVALSESAIDENAVTVLSGHIQDPGSVDTFVLDLNWGDPLSPDDIQSFQLGSVPFTEAIDGINWFPETREFTLSHQYLDDNGSGDALNTYRIQANVVDDDGAAGGTHTLVDVRNIAPAIETLLSSSGSPATRSDDGVVVIDGTFSDTGTLDTHSSQIDWGDGSAVEEVDDMDQLADTFTAMHQYSSGGIYTVTVTLTDDDGQSVSQSTAAVVTGVGVVGDTLFVIGTDGRDHVTLKHRQKKDELKVKANLNQGGDEDSRRGRDGSGEVRRTIRETYRASAIERIVTYLFAGDDHYDGGANGDGDDDKDGRNSVTTPQIVFGGAGRDQISGGQGNDVLFGGAGRDHIKGRGGADILVGGDGRDKLKGGRGDDLLIGGELDVRWEDALNLGDLDTALAAWCSGGLGDALDLMGNVLDDDDKDDLFGQQGLNTLIGGIGDRSRK